MTIEQQLIHKRFYETLIENQREEYPLMALGHLYLAEQKQAIPNLSNIRFAQGEIYFHHHDYEAAIFKWENIDNELIEWAKKNMADAYYHLDLLSTADNLYQSIETDSDILKAEVLLARFSVYTALGKLDAAVDVMKEAVAFNPDYDNVTHIAQTFFEKHQDWKNAIELAVNESVRTGRAEWFDRLQMYVSEGKTKKIEPDYFQDVLVSLKKLDLAKFENLAVSLWHQYRGTELYVSWIKNINHILLRLDGGGQHSWRALSAIYGDTFYEFINGQYLIREIADIIPNHLMNWVKIADDGHALPAAAAVLAWSEIFPSGIDPDAMSLAEKKLRHMNHYEDGLEEGFDLFKSVISWARKKGIEIGYRFEWMVKELLNLDTPNLLIAGAANNGKSSFMNGLFGKKLVSESFPTTIMFKDGAEEEMNEISEEGIRSIAHLSEIQENKQTMVLYHMPLPFLSGIQLNLIDTPGLKGLNKFQNDVFQYVQFADSLLFVLNAERILIEEELEMIVEIREQAPDLPIHFLLNRTDYRHNEKDLIEQASSKIHTYFPKSRLFAFSGNNHELHDLGEFFLSITSHTHIKEKRTAKLQHYIRKTIKYLLERRIEMENGLIESVKWNEDMVTKLTGATNQLGDLEEEKVRMMKRSFAQIKEDIKEQLLDDIPALLRDCSDIIEENSDVTKLDIMLNAEMNTRIRQHLNDAVMPDFHKSFRQWIQRANEEFMEAQSFLEDMGSGLNDLYEEKKLTLDCDFKVLDDWRRDGDRMTRGYVEVGSINIINRFSPSQFLLKSAGRILGAIQQNKAILSNKYKQLVETADYSEVASSVADQFFQPFELFEKSIDRDVSMFFSPPATEISAAMEEALCQIETNKESLRKMSENPELYRDPLTLFQLQLLQLEWKTRTSKGVYQP